MASREAVINEMWVEYAVGVSFLLLRIFTRCKIVVGWRWEGDDYLAVAAVIFFTFEVAFCQIISVTGSITGLTAETALALTPQEASDHALGSKLLFIGWYLYVSLIWSLKGIMLFLFARLTKTLPEGRLLKLVSITTVAAYIATIGVISGHCRPVSQQWQIYPLPDRDCSENTSKFYTLVTTNVITDLLIMFIPLPLLWRVQTTFKRKIFFGLGFCAGGFIVICTILRCVFCLKDPSRLDLALTWSMRETLVGILATNCIPLAPLFNKYGGSVARSLPSREHPGNLVTIGGTGEQKLTRFKNHLHLPHIHLHHNSKFPRSINDISEESIFNGGVIVNPAEISIGDAIPAAIESRGHDIQVTKTVDVISKE